MLMHLPLLSGISLIKRMDFFRFVGKLPMFYLNIKDVLVIHAIYERQVVFSKVLRYFSYV